MYLDYVCPGTVFCFNMAFAPTGTGSEKPASRQHGAGWTRHPEPHLFPGHGSGCQDHDHQQLRPIPQQVRVGSLIKKFGLIKVLKAFLNLNLILARITHLNEQCENMNDDLTLT